MSDSPRKSGDDSANLSHTETEQSDYLIVVAHPDDEVLGAGATAAALTARGHQVRACILSGEVTARLHRPSDTELLEDTRAAASVLGMQEPILGSFPNIAMNTVPHLSLVQFIESAIESTGASRILTHHPSDLNDDHRQVSAACQAAARLSFRRAGVSRLKALHFMEVLSSTDWAFPGPHEPFQPTAFFEVGEANLRLKLEALGCYRDVIRPFPHSRSETVIRSLAALRGAQSAMNYAEAFQVAFTDIGVDTRGAHV